MVRLPTTNLRLGVVTKVSQKFVECEYLGYPGETPAKCAITHPYVSNGGGFLAGIEVGTVVLLGVIPPSRRFIVCCIPSRSSFFDREGVSDVPFYLTPLPVLEEGELLIKQSKSGSYINLLPDGSMLLDADIGDSEADIELSPLSKTFYTRVDNRYDFTEASRRVEGIVKRDKNKNEISSDTKTINFLTGDIYEDLLSSIGRSPTDEVQNRTTTIVRSFTRNPALVEKREIVYEYANSFGVRNISAEANAMITAENTTGVENLIAVPGARNNRRTDILNLGMFNYNHLIERVEGTVVDIYGNVLDINRNVINIPDVDTLGVKDGKTKELQKLQNLYRYMRRSVKYHFEVNARKEIEGDEPSRKSSNNYGKIHSRWSVDIDGEGQTKINIPASSETGNIPVLGRYFQSISDSKEERDIGQYKDKKFVDVRMSPFGTETQQISNSEYAPTTLDNGSATTAGTTYHDLMQVADLVFTEGKWGREGPRMESSIDNKIGSDNANAGGRSVHANLDGSLEMSIGADSVDNKSMLLDLQGALISHFGKDKNGRSVIHQNDGDVLIQIGGEGIDNSGFRSGRLEVHLARQDGDPQKIIIDEDGITIDVQGNALFSSSGDMTLGAGGRMLLAGELIFHYGTFDSAVDGTRKPQGTERLIIRNGIPNQL